MQPQLRVDIPTADNESTSVINENSQNEHIITLDQGALAQEATASNHKRGYTVIEITQDTGRG